MSHPPSEPGWGEPPYQGGPSHQDQPPYKGDPQHWGGQPSYAPQPPYGQYGPPPPTGGNMNVMAILSLVFAFVFAPVAIVLGHMARRQIRQTHEQGDQLAFWGLLLGYVFTGLYVLGCCGWLALVVWAGANSGTTT